MVVPQTFFSFNKNLIATTDVNSLMNIEYNAMSYKT